MAALHSASAPRLVPLWEVRGNSLKALLAQEVKEWRSELDWDFRASADLVSRYAAMHSLEGFALIQNGLVAGYTYFIVEEGKGIVGDLFVLPERRTPAAEAHLLAGAVRALLSRPLVKRIECQLLMMREAQSALLPAQDSLRLFPRLFLQAPADCADKLPRSAIDNEYLFSTWDFSYLEEAAGLIRRSYQNHVDSEVNDQYRSLSGARRFLRNITQYAGCGQFSETCSWAAFLPESGTMEGMCLTSLVAERAGHITQVCVSPSCRGKRLGYELIRRALTSLASAGVSSISLTVTEANQRAVQLYYAMGFKLRRRFAACVWDGF